MAAKICVSVFMTAIFLCAIYDLLDNIKDVADFGAKAPWFATSVFCLMFAAVYTGMLLIIWM